MDLTRFQATLVPIFRDAECVRALRDFLTDVLDESEMVLNVAARNALLDEGIRLTALMRLGRVEFIESVLKMLDDLFEKNNKE